MKPIKIPRLFKQKKVLAATARRASAAGMEFDGIPEPNMKLSRALLIVLLLHVVAVSGIIAFNAIKTRQGPSLPRVKTAASPSATKPEVSGTSAADASSAPGHHEEIRKAKPVAATGKDHRKGSDPTHCDEPHKNYTAAKRDTPGTIAKKFKVPFDDLLALNHIEDPRKLKPGQKLLIPNKPAKGKKGDD